MSVLKKIWEINPFKKNIFKSEFGGRKETLLLISFVVFCFGLNGLVVTRIWEVKNPLYMIGISSVETWELGDLSINFSYFLTMLTVATFIVVLAKRNQGHAAIPSSMEFISSKPTEEEAVEMKKPGINLGYTTDTAMPLKVSYEMLFKHWVITGSTGSGKTTIMRGIMGQNIRNGGGCIFIDGKQNKLDFQVFYDMCYSLGRHNDVLVIAPGDPKNSHTYNPILMGDTQELADRIISLIPEDARAEFYRNEGYKALVAVIDALSLKKVNGVRIPFNMLDLSILLSTGEALLELEKELKEMFAKPELKDTIEYQKVYQFSLYLNGYRTKGEFDMAKLKANISSVATKPFIFGSGAFGEVTKAVDPDVTLLDAIINNKIIYIMLPTMGKGQASKEFAKLFMADLRTTAAWLNATPSIIPKIPYLVVMDEAGGYMNDSQDILFQQARSAGLSLLISAQSISNFSQVSEFFWDKVKENTITAIFMKMQTDSGTLEASKLCGNQWHYTQSLNYGTGDSSSGTNKSVTDTTQGNSSNIGLTQTQVELPRVRQEDLRGLGIGEAIVLLDGKSVYHIKTAYITSQKHKKFELRRKPQSDKIIGLNLGSRIKELVEGGAARSKGNDYNAPQKEKQAGFGNAGFKSLSTKYDDKA